MTATLREASRRRPWVPLGLGCGALALAALLSVTDQANEPRYPNFQAIMAARKRTVERLTLADLGIDPRSVGAVAARTEVLEATERPPRQDRVLVTDDGDAGARLARHLVDQRLV